MNTERHPEEDFFPDRYPLQTFCPEDWQWFLRACNTLDIPVDDDKKPVLEALYSHLAGVNQWLNLTRLTTPIDYLRNHVLDSLTALNVARAVTRPGDLALDLGSGGGYPGLPLMTWLPDRRWLLVDSRPKKAAFLSVALTLTPCRHAAARAFCGHEAPARCPEAAGHCRLVTARAVGKAVDLLPEAEKLLARHGTFLLLKGPAYATEEREPFIKALPKFGMCLAEETKLPLHLPELGLDQERWLVSAKRLR